MIVSSGKDKISVGKDKISGARERELPALALLAFTKDLHVASNVDPPLRPLISASSLCLGLRDKLTDLSSCHSTSIRY
jgi:hypothetical protein